jgi:hypothetical protein
MTPSELVQLIHAMILWLYWNYAPDPCSYLSQLHLSQVLDMSQFAGHFWQEADSGMATWWAAIMDNMLDILDPGSLIRGDH